MAYLTENELRELNFRSVGKNVKISNKCSIYGTENISIGDNVRIDDFCVISAVGKEGYLEIGNYIHIAIYVGLFAGAGIRIENFCIISSKATLYSTSDDFSGNSLLVAPMIPEEYLNTDKRPIIMKNYSAIGAHALVLPGVTLGEGAVLGAMSLANKSLEPWFIYGGIPAKKIKERKKGLLQKAEAVMQQG